MLKQCNVTGYPSGLDRELALVVIYSITVEPVANQVLCFRQNKMWMLATEVIDYKYFDGGGSVFDDYKKKSWYILKNHFAWFDGSNVFIKNFMLFLIWILDG